jgi:hypothetical protein
MQVPNTPIAAEDLHPSSIESTFVFWSAQIEVELFPFNLDAAMIG